jgi:hypothetical protein
VHLVADADTSFRVDILGSHFSANSAKESGGGVSLQGQSETNAKWGQANVTVSGSTFVGNRDGVSGGGFHFTPPELKIDVHLKILGSRFSGNTAQSTGGGINSPGHRCPSRAALGVSVPCIGTLVGCRVPSSLTSP